MNPANFLRVSPSARRSVGAVVALCCCLPALLAQSEPQLQFVKILADKPMTYRPPSGFGPGETLGVRIAGFPRGDGLELRVDGLVNHSPDRGYEQNETVMLLSLPSAELRKQNVATDAFELVVPLSTIDLQGPMEVTARLLGKDGRVVGSPVKLTLNSATSVQASPSLLQKAVAAGWALVDRVATIYDVVRSTEEPRSVFSVSLENGRPVSAPAVLSLEPAQFRYLALSPEGKRLAWVKSGPRGYELWTSNLDKIAPVRIATAGDEILTPTFADESLLLYVSRSALILAEQANEPRALRLPLRSVTRINHVRRNGSRIECIVSAEHTDSPSLILPYLVRISVPEGETAVFRLPVNPFYQSYSLLVEGVPFFFAGTEGGVEGVHYFRLDGQGDRVDTLYKVRAPAFVAIAANGTRLVFAGNK